MAETLVVVLYGEVVGELRRSSPGSTPAFTYTADYLATGTVPLSVRLPLSASQHLGRSVERYLDSLLPENRATRQRWARVLDAGADDAFALLAGMGWDCPGAVQICPPDQLGAMLSRTEVAVPYTEEQIGQRLRALQRDPASWSMPAEHWSLPGQQDKFALAWDGRSWSQALGAAPTTHIIKPGIGVLQAQALVEHATMRAAAALGVDVATTQFRQFDGEPAIVVNRFDRILRRDGSVIRLHQEDFCSATGRRPEDKYEASGGPTLADLVRVVRRNSTELQADLRGLADFLMINYVAGAPDGHSKNISLSLHPDGIRVAPLYDLATGFA